MAENKIPEDTRKKISEAMQKSWVKRKRKSASSGTSSSPKADILNTIDQTTQTLKS